MENTAELYQVQEELTPVLDGIADIFEAAFERVGIPFPQTTENCRWVCEAGVVTGPDGAPMPVVTYRWVCQ